MQQYKDLAQRIIDEGEHKENRTGVDTYSVFGAQLRFKMSDGFPLVTVKETHAKSIFHELLWFISGSSNIRYLQENGVSIWNSWADASGELGPVYGVQWRRWLDTMIECHADIASELVGNPLDAGYKFIAPLGPDASEAADWGLFRREIDQLQNVIDKLRSNPNDRRLIVSAWNPAVLPDDDKTFSENVANGKQALPPCHAFFQFHHINGKLSLQIYQRSVDVFLGLPFNIASYALLLHMVAQQTDLVPHELVWTGGDVHLYENHIEQTKIMLDRECLVLPTLELNRRDSIDDYTFDDIKLTDYYFHSKLKGKVAV